MCPFCIGAATWAAAGAISAGGVGLLAAVVTGQRRTGAGADRVPDSEDGGAIGQPQAD